MTTQVMVAIIVLTGIFGVLGWGMYLLLLKVYDAWQADRKVLLEHTDQLMYRVADLSYARSIEDHAAMQAQRGPEVERVRLGAPTDEEEWLMEQKRQHVPQDVIARDQQAGVPFPAPEPDQSK